MFSQLPSATGMFSQIPRHERKHPPYTFPPPFKSAEKRVFWKKKYIYSYGKSRVSWRKKIASLFLGVHDLDESAAAEVEKSPLDRVGRWLWRRRRGKVALRRRRMRFLSSSRETSIYHKKSNSVFIFFPKKCWLFTSGKCMVANIFLELAFVWRIPPVSYTTPCFMNTKEEEEEVFPPYPLWDIATLAFITKKEEERDCIRILFCEKKPGDKLPFPPLFRARNAGESFSLFWWGLHFPRKRRKRVFLLRFSLSLPPFSSSFSGRWVSSFFLSVSFFVFPQSHGLMCLVCETRKGGEGSS